MDPEVLVDFKILVLEELLKVLKVERTHKIVMMDWEGKDIEFFDVHFSLSGDSFIPLDKFWSDNDLPLHLPENSR